MIGNKFIIGCTVLVLLGCKKENHDDDFPAAVTDIDGNVYSTVKIGYQLWMTENLKTTRYNDGTLIPTGLNYSGWENTVSGAYGVNSVVPGVYGNYYNWFAVNTGMLCPKGWHIPSTAEWQALSMTLGGDSIAGGKMKSTSSLWASPNAGATNSSGFNALPAGFHYGGSTSNYKIITRFWSTSTIFQTRAYNASLNSDFPNFSTTDYGIFTLGHSCRCLKN
jgi:uncharacterized protein (TIGR02145 family)